MAHLLIDGYNYINRIRGDAAGGASLEMLRHSFLDGLARYKRLRGGKITVVFDAYQSPSLGRHQENFKGIEVVYSRENETADEVIIEWIRKKPSGLVVVTSDRAILDEAKIHGIAFLTPVKLAETMTEGMMNSKSSFSSFQKEEDDIEERQRDKKGNPRKLPKKLRKVVHVVEELSWKK